MPTWITTAIQVAKSDYAANAGDALIHAGNSFGSDQMWPPNGMSYAEIDSQQKWMDTSCKTTPSRSGPMVSRYCQTGVMFYRSETNTAKILDGSTSTYLIGEKFLSPFMYDRAEATYRGYGDNQSAWSGFEWDNHRVAWNNLSTFSREDCQPRRDMDGVDNPNIVAFGSAHVSNLNMAMCDGSVQVIAYDIDSDTHRALANRLDAIVVNLQK